MNRCTSDRSERHKSCDLWSRFGTLEACNGHVTSDSHNRFIVIVQECITKLRLARHHRTPTLDLFVLLASVRAICKFMPSSME